MRVHLLAAAAALTFGMTAARAQTTMPTMPSTTMPSTGMPTTGMPTPGNQQDMMKMMHLAAHNQLGVLEYCQSNGFVGPDVIALQRKMLGMLPPAQVDGLDAAEDAGKKGVVVFAGNQVPIADAARGQNTTPEAMCKQMGSMLQSQASRLTQ